MTMFDCPHCGDRHHVNDFCATGPLAAHPAPEQVAEAQDAAVGGLLERLEARQNIMRTAIGSAPPVNPDGPEAASVIRSLQAERDALKAAKWDVKHVDTMNDFVSMGMARDEATANLQLIAVAGDRLYAALGNYEKPGEGLLTQAVMEAGAQWCRARAALAAPGGEGEPIAWRPDRAETSRALANLDPADFRKRYEEAREWSGSAWLAGEKITVEERKRLETEMYSWMCRTGNFFDWWADMAQAVADELAEGGGPSSAWLIEKFSTSRQAHLAEWWGLGEAHGEDGQGWTKDSLLALRFARQEDAQAYIDNIGWTEARPTEHAWAALTAPSPNKGQSE